MSGVETILCSNDKVVVLDTISISNCCPPILKRFLGLSGDTVGCFEEAARDEYGRLTFAKYLDITRTEFQACIAFIKTGYIGSCVGSINTLIFAMDRMGGSEQLDAYIAKKQAEQEALEEYEMVKRMSEQTNPMTPEADIDQLFIWRAAQSVWAVRNPEDWSMTVHTGIALDYWWRKRNPVSDTVEEDIRA